MCRGVGWGEERTGAPHHSGWQHSASAHSPSIAMQKTLLKIKKLSLAARGSTPHCHELTFAFCQSQMKEEGKQILAPRVTKQNRLRAFCAAIASENKEGSQLIDK